MTIFDYKSLDSTYADDKTFFLKDVISIKHIVDTFVFFFSFFSGLKTKLIKSEIASVEVLKGFQVAVCGMCCINQNNDTFKILGIHFFERGKKFF